MFDRISLGTVQSGLPYGITNTDGPVASEEAHAILSSAYRHGIRKLDTAASYGPSESVIGSLGKHGWTITTKLASLPNACPSVAVWVEAELKASLVRGRSRELNAAGIDLQVRSIFLQGLRSGKPTSIRSSSAWTARNSLRHCWR